MLEFDRMWILIICRLEYLLSTTFYDQLIVIGMLLLLMLVVAVAIVEMTVEVVT